MRNRAERSFWTLPDHLPDLGIEHSIWPPRSRSTASIERSMSTATRRFSGVARRARHDRHEVRLRHGSLCGACTVHVDGVAIRIGAMGRSPSLPRRLQTGPAPRRREVSFRHVASFRCGAKVQALLEVKRTCRDRRHRINPTRLTLSRQKHEYFAAAHTRQIVRRCARL
jgi:hypothetical protein